MTAPAFRPIRLLGEISVRALLIGPNKSKYCELDSIFGEVGWQLSHVDSWKQASALPELVDFTHFFFEDTSRDHDWVLALEEINSLPSAASFILVTRLGDDRLWSEVLMRGGYDVLMEPFHPMEVTRVVHAARQHSLRQRAQAPPATVVH